MLRPFVTCRLFLTQRALFIVPDADVMAGCGVGVPGDVKPGGTGEELVSKGVGFEEVDEALELSRIFRADVGGLADEVLGIGDTANQTINPTVAEARIDDDGADDLPGWLQQHDAAIGHVCHIL